MASWQESSSTVKQLDDKIEPRMCEMCSTKMKPRNEVGTMYCMETYCDECSGAHTQTEATRSHHQVKLDDATSSKAEASQTVCDKHPNKPLKLFCGDCKMAICVICCIDSHERHGCSDISKVIDTLRQQITTDIGSIVEGVRNLGEMSKSVKDQKETFVRRVAETRDEITKACKELKHLIERNKQTLLNELETKKDGVVKQLDNVNHDITQQMSLMENFKKYIEELRNKGTASAIAGETNVIHDRVQELLNYRAIKRSRDDIHSIKVKFMTSSIQYNKESLIGNIDIEVACKKVQPPLPTLIREINGSNINITGVSLLGSQLFVVRRTVKQIEVYDATTFAPQRDIYVPGIPNSYGLASCPVYNCLYASNYSNTDNLYRIEPSDDDDDHIIKWTVGSRPAGVCVNTLHNVLVVCQRDHKLQEYTTRGSLVREIDLQPSGIRNPWYAVQLSSSHFAVTTNDNRVCVVDINGQMVHRYGSASAGSVVGRLNFPRGLLQHSNGCFLVADCNNHRLVLLDSSLNFLSYMFLPIDGGLGGPWCLFLDESRGRLCVGEGRKFGRVLVFDNVDIE